MSEAESENTPNDDWSATNTTWGESFLLEIESKGRENVGETGVIVADEAATKHLKETDGYHPPEGGKPSKRGKNQHSVKFRTETASLTATLYSNVHSAEDAAELFGTIEETLADASSLERIAVTVEEDWQRVEEVDD